jgi:hypothetical protein
LRDRIRTIRSVALAVLLACSACFVLAGPVLAAETNTYTEGTGGRGFSIDSRDEAWSWDKGAADETLTLTLNGLQGLSTPAIASSEIAGVFELGGQPVGKVGFIKFRLTVDIAIDAAFSPLPVVSYTSRPDGSDFHDANVSLWAPPVLEFEVLPRSSDGEQPGGALLTYQISFQVPSGGANGTITIHDFTVEYGEYVQPPEDDGDGGDGSDKHDGEDGGTSDRPSGVAYMGGSDDGGSGSGSGGSGTGSGQGGGNSAGVRVGEGTGSIDTEAPVTASPRSTADDTVTGYPLRLEDVTGGGGEAGGGTGDGPGGGAAGTGTSGGAAGSGVSWKDLVWLAAALAITTPFVSAELDRRRVRRRLQGLVEQTPDGSAPSVTASA